MAKTKAGFIMLACISSGLAVILSMVSVGTQQWIVAEARFNGPSNEANSKVTYGLFAGVFEQTYSNTAFEITMTCLFSKNVCAMLCKTTSDGRTEELKKLYDGSPVIFDSKCTKVQRTFRTPDPPNNPGHLRDASQRTFINAGVYLSTLIFLGISIVCGLLSTALGIWNSGGNPIQSLFNILGLYIYNSVSAVFILLAVIVWGVHFQTTLIDNACILNSITGVMETWGDLGFSYWINIGSFILYCTSITLLYSRQYLIEREPHIKEDIDDDQDAGIIIMY